MKLARWAAFSAAMAAAGCTVDSTQDVTRLAVEPALTGGTYSTGGGLTVASAFRNIDGRTALCGLWSESTAQTPYSKGKAKDILASGSVYLGGKRLLTGLGYFTKMPPGTDYSVKDASCRVTERAWRPEYANQAPVITLPQQIIYRDLSGSGGPIVDFKQTGPGALSGSLNLVQKLFYPTVQIPLGSVPVLAGGRYSTGGEISTAIELRQIGKAAYVCGVWTETRGASVWTEKQAPEILARGKVTQGDKTLADDLRFLRRVLSRPPLARKTANCIDTGVAWSDLDPAAPMRVRFPRVQVHSGPGQPITFLPTSARG